MKKDSNGFYSHIRQVHMDFHMPEFPKNAITNFDAKAFVKHLVHGKINMVALFAKCHFGNSFYDTRVGHKHTGLPNDFLREAAEECRKHGIRTLAYYSLSTDKWAYDHYPHWRKVAADGTHPPVNGPWARVCINTPYREELALPQCEEIARDYPVDGFFIDIPLSGRCFCRWCKEKFAVLHGKELTESVPGIEQDAFDYNSTARFLKELRHIINTHNPELKIVTNRGGHLYSPRSFSDCNDFGVWESQPKSNYLSHSFACRAVRTLDMPVQVMSVRFYQGWGDLSLKPTAQMTTEFAAMIGNGCAATSGDQVNVDGTLQPAVYDMFNKSFGFVEAREAILAGAESVKHAAILAPVARYDYPADVAEGPAMQGAHKALLESHVQFDILSALDIDKLDAYKIAVLTEPCSFDPAVFPKLEQWVKKGGTLVAAGSSLIEGGRFHLQEVLGIDFIDPSVFSVSHFKPEPALAGAMDDLPLQCRAKSYKVFCKGADRLARYYYPQTECTPDHAFRNPQCPPANDEPSPYPFATLNTYGKGKAVYIAASIFEAYWRYNHHWLRQFVEAVFKHVDPAPPCRADISGIVETNLMRAANGDLLLNLIHYQVGHQGAREAIPAIESVHPITQIACQVKAAGVKQVRLEPAGTEIAFKQDGDYVAFSVPQIEYLGIVRVVT
ncbi:MAG: alpha-L-fucosidase [Kiritimatiellae bacterium]|nr:alpha-L-fucosidase [Kiritimatiellia bacterium]